jgi:hypothetical protein
VAGRQVKRINRRVHRISQTLWLCQYALMPTVLKLDGLRVRIYPNDHRPAHVHVLGAGTEAVFFLNCPNGPSSLRESFGFTGQELRAVAAALDGAVKALCKNWETFHGAY